MNKQNGVHAALYEEHEERKGAFPAILEDTTKYTHTPIAPDIFFQTLDNCSVNDVKGGVCMAERYSTLSGNKIYDAVTNNIYSDDEWPAYENNKERTSYKLSVLSKHGLDKAYVSLCSWLKDHDEVREVVIPSDPSSTPVVKTRDLSYGYAIEGFLKQKNAVVWRIRCYDRVIEEKDVLRGMDTVFLLFDGETVKEAGKRGLIERMQNPLSAGNLSDDEWNEIVPIPDSMSLS